MKKTTMKNMFRLLLIVAMACGFPPISRAETSTSALPNLRFNCLSSLNGLPSDEVQSLYQDSMGFVWIGTRAGLYRYDGYRVETFRNDLEMPRLFTSNSVLSLTEDGHRRLWIGTENGLNILNLATGDVRKIIFRGPREQNFIHALHRDRRGDVWIGTEGGLLLCRAADGRFCNLSRGGIGRGAVPTGAVEALCETDSGILYVGTRGSGLYRREGAGASFRQCLSWPAGVPVSSLFADSRGTLWAGSRGSGLYRLAPSAGSDARKWEALGPASGLPDQFVYGMTEDRSTHTLWVATRSGLFVLPVAENRGISYRNDSPVRHIPCNEVTTVMQDRAGLMWLGTLGGGVLNTNTSLSPVHNVSFAACAPLYGLNGVRSLYVDEAGTVWIGVDKEGLMCYDSHSGSLSSWRSLADFAGLASLPPVVAFLPMPGGWLCLGTDGGGVYAYRKGKPVRSLCVRARCPYLPSDRIAALARDAKGNLLIATQQGLALSHPDGSGVLLNRYFPGIDLSQTAVSYIEPGRAGDYWLCTSRYGALHLTGDLSNPASLRCCAYCADNGRLPVQSLQTMLLDRHGRLWGASLEYGLFLYDSLADCFRSVNKRFAISSQRICALEEDAEGHLWLSTNSGLLHLAVSDDLSHSSVRAFNTSDGLQSNYYAAGVSARRNGWLFFGYYGGFSYFSPSRIEIPPVSTPTRITEIRIEGSPLRALSPKERAEVSPNTSAYASRIVLSHGQNDISLEFANLSYAHASKSRYAYRLEGYETEWKQVDAAHRVATYTNLPSGTYTFSVRATDLTGVWQSTPTRLEVVVRPPWWLTGWAFAGYAVALCGLVWALRTFFKRRAALHGSLRSGEQERAKMAEVNHNKLSFFTNIAHELVAPLSVLSAATDELRAHLPKGSPQYEVIHSNISRLMRLLQQLVEFRKADSGHLPLRVAEGDFPAFVQREVRDLIPLMRNRCFRLEYQAQPSSFRVYFDADLIDKLLYNLLSAVVRLNPQGADAELSVTYDADADLVRLSVCDRNGHLPAGCTVDSLFEPFTEKQTPINPGAAAGFYVAKQLLVQHRGHIVAKEGSRGVLFTVSFPGRREAYRPDEIAENCSLLQPEAEEERTASLAPADVSPEPVPAPAEPLSAESGGEDGGGIPSSAFAFTLLLVESDADLAGLLKRQLEPAYHVLVTRDGAGALQVMDRREVDLVVGDFMAAPDDVAALCRALKGEPRYCHIPLVLLLTKGREEESMQAYGLGVDGYVSKPFSMDLLRACVANLLRTRVRTASDVRNKYALQWDEARCAAAADADFLRRANDCIRRNLANADFSQQQFADEMLSSKSTLFKKLKLLTGMNPSSFIRNIRLKAACHILRERPTIRITELAELVGFGDAKYFSVCFKREFHLTPSEFAARCG